MNAIERVVDAGLGGVLSAIGQSLKAAEKLAVLHSTVQWRQYDLRYRGTAGDIFVVSFPKSGTTLVQMLLHQIITDSNIDFSHISQFSPFLEEDLLREFVTRRTTIDDLPHPHVIKSHLPYRSMPTGPGKYIYVMRCGLDVAVSYYFGQSCNRIDRSPNPQICNQSSICNRKI